MPKQNGENGDAVSREEFNEVIKAIQGLATGMKDLNTTLVVVQGQQVDGLNEVKNQTDAAKKAALAAAKADKEKKDAPASGDDLDGMSGSQLAGYMLDQMKVLLTPVSDRISQEADSTEAGKARASLEAAVKKYPDFIDFKNEIQLELKGNPYLTPEQAYLLAKNNNPEKVEALETKTQERKEADDKKTAETKEAEDKVKMKETADKVTGELFGDAAGSFGGLHPTSGEGSGGTQKQDMTTDEASDAAWVEVFGASGIAQ